MMGWKQKSPLLVTALPLLAEEVKSLLVKEGREGLAAQVDGLHVMGRCKCGDDFCAQMYVQPPPQGKFPGELENLALSPEEGYLILDVVDGRIATIEALYRPEIRKVLLEMFP